MRSSCVRLTFAAAIGLSLAIASVGAASAESVTEMCGEEWNADQIAGTTNGETWPQFLAQCRAAKAGVAETPSPAPTTRFALPPIPDLR